MKRSIYHVVGWLNYELPDIDPAVSESIRHRVRSLRTLHSILIPGGDREWAQFNSLARRPASLGVYVALLRAASKMFPRGVFINEHGIGLTLPQIAREARVDLRSLKAAWPVLLKINAIATVSTIEVGDIIESLEPHIPGRVRRRKDGGESPAYGDRIRSVDRRFHERRVAARERRMSYPGAGRDARKTDS